MAEAKVLKTFSMAYKKQIEDLVNASKKFPPAEEEEENEASLIKKKRKNYGQVVYKGTHYSVASASSIQLLH